MNNSILDNKIEKLIEGLNEQQTQAVLNPINSCTKIVAGAGTGKTKIISKRFVKLVLEMMNNTQETIQNPQERILVITFTDKAAAEMKERIYNELKSFNIETLGQDLWISTFHSFCIKILKKYSIEANLSPSFKIADEKQLEKIYDNIIKKIKYNEAFSITNIDESLNKIGLDKKILNIESLSSLKKINDIETVLSDIYQIIKKIKSLGINAKEFIERSKVAIKKYSKVIETTPFKFETKEEYTNEWAQHYQSYIDDYCDFDEAIFDSIAKEKLILDKNRKRKPIEYGMAQNFPENIPNIEEIELFLTDIIAAIYELYQAELERQNLVDFDDLINKTIQIFKTNDLIREHYQNHFKQIIVDEFQDTNGAQLELIELLLDRKHANLTYVGDRKQSIYAFRFAQMENLEVLQKNVESKYNQKFQPINLSTNYRSTPEVLNAVNYVTEHELSLNNENLYANPNIQYPDTKADIKVTVVEGFDNAHEQKIAEAKYIADEITRLKTRDTASFKEFAVLVKSHSQADIIERELKKKNIPSVKKVNTGFFKEPVIKNIVALFKLVKNIEDEISFIRLLQIKYNDADLYQLKKEIDETLAENITFEEIKKLNFVQKYIYLKFNGQLKNLSYADTIFESISEIKKKKSLLNLAQIYETLKQKIVLASVSNDIDKIQVHNNIKIFEKILDDYIQNEEYKSVNHFIDYIEKISEDRTFELPSPQTETIDAVQIMTIHASKGLEFPYTFILSITTASKNADKNNIIFDMQYGAKPGFGIIINKFNGKTTPKSMLYKKIWQAPREENENLRLFYVAVSRAKKYLNVLSFNPYGNNNSIKPVSYILNLQEFLN